MLGGNMPTIALVDDDRNILTSVSIALEAEGYRSDLSCFLRTPEMAAAEFDADGGQHVHQETSLGIVMLAPGDDANVAFAADKRTRSKWSRVLRYVAAYKPDSEPVETVIKRDVGYRLDESHHLNRG
jgi:hypothetical protein